MTRRLLGYVVKLPDGTRSPRTPKPVELYLAEHAWCATDDDAGDYVVPVFATRKPKPAPAGVVDTLALHATYQRQVAEASEPKPAPVVAAEGLPTRFALPSDFVPKMRARIRDHDGVCGCVECVAYCLGFADCEDDVESKSKTRRRKSTVEAIEAARREGAEAARIDALLGLRDACELKADTVSDEAAIGLRMAMLFVDKALTKTAEEAAKGQAK